MALAEQADLVAQLSLKDEFSQKLKTAESRLKSIEKSFSRTRESLGDAARNFRLIGFAALGAGAAAVKFAADFEEQLATINTVANVTDERLLEIGESLRAMARTTGTSLDDLSGAYYDLVSAGVDAADAQLVLESANKLAIGGLSTTGEAVDLLTTAINAYGLKTSEVTTITDGFAQAIAAGKVTASEIAGSFARVAPLAASAGIEIDELQAAFAQMTAKGVPAAEVSTNLRQAINALQKPTAALKKAQADLGVNFQKIAKQKGLAVAYQQLTKYAKEHNVELIDLVGRVEGVQFALTSAGPFFDEYQENLRLVRRASEDGGVAAQQFEKRQQTLNATFGRIRETVRDVAITFGNVFAPAIERVASTVLTIIETNRPAIQEFADNLKAVVDSIFTPENVSSGLQSALSFLKNLPWDTIGAGLALTGRVAKAAVDAFNNLPKEAQTAIIGLLAANKLLGGTIGSVIGDLAGLALRSLTTINAVNVTVVGRNVTGTGTPGVDVPSGGGGIGGALGTFLRAIPILGPALTMSDEQKGKVLGSVALRNAPEEVKREFARRGGTIEDVTRAGMIALETDRPVAEVLREIVDKLGVQITSSTPRMLAVQQELLEQAKRQEGIIAAQKAKAFETHDELVASRELSAEQRERLQRIVYKLEQGKIDAEEANRRLGKIQDEVRAQDLSVEVNIDAQTNVNVAEVGQKIVVAQGGGRFLIR